MKSFFYLFCILLRKGIVKGKGMKMILRKSKDFYQFSMQTKKVLSKIMPNGNERERKDYKKDNFHPLLLPPHFSTTISFDTIRNSPMTHSHIFVCHFPYKLNSTHVKCEEI